MAKLVTVTATRDWQARCDADWLVITPASGTASADPQDVYIYPESANNGVNRTATVTFATSSVSKQLTVTQLGTSGSLEDTYVYHNNFDKEEATQAYGTSGQSWPYLDQFEGWKMKKVPARQKLNTHSALYQPVLIQPQMAAIQTIRALV